MRIDLLLYRLRLARTRGAAQALVEARHVRLGGERVVRCSREVAPGDVLTLPRGKGVLVCRIESLPERRGPAAEAMACYRVLDPAAQSDLAGGQDKAPTRKDRSHP